MTQLYKYPRTIHLPHSPGATRDDRRLSNTNHFDGKVVIVTEKMDGENTSLYRDSIHARSLDYSDHPSRHWMKTWWHQIKYKIPQELRICGENIFAKHSIAYDNLPHYFCGFSVWDRDLCLDWNQTLEVFKMVGITPVPVIYYGVFHLNAIQLSADIMLADHESEGYVIRNVEEFHHHNFDHHVAKFVRSNHVQTSDHWLRQKVIKNKLG